MKERIPKVQALEKAAVKMFNTSLIVGTGLGGITSYLTKNWVYTGLGAGAGFFFGYLVVSNIAERHEAECSEEGAKKYKSANTQKHPDVNRLKF